MPRDSFNSIVQQVPDRETSSDVEPTLIIGRDEAKHKILSILSESNTKEMTILPIYGIGGIGKTTLAQLLFNDRQFHEYSLVWVYVSQKFDLKKIGNSIISQLTNEISHIAEAQMLHNRLGELFDGKSILIVLDDLWEEKQHELDKLKTMLRPGLGSKFVIVTTRDEAIARKISSTVVPYKLEILTDDMCWTIIKQKSVFEDRDDREQLEQIGRDIAIKCGGVPLAAQSLGYMLRDMESDQWESVRDSYIWSLSTMEDPSLRNHEVLLSLLLSYSHMHEFLQLCFSYCAVFPKGHNIVKSDLIHQWISLGLTGPSSTFDSMQLCEKYITQLLGLSFLQKSKTPSTMDVNNTFLIMHDLVHDLARSVMADEINIESPACRYAWLTDHRKLFESSVNPLAMIRALHVVDRGYLQLHAEAFSPAKCLSVLDLSRCCTEELPESIGQLKQLRYLNASLKLDFTDISEFQAPSETILIPKALGSLKKLQYLNLSDRLRPIGLPEVISELIELRYLNISSCRGCYLLDSPSANQSFIDCIGTLPNLEQLDMSWNNYGFCVPESFSSLKKLNLSDCYHISSIPENVAKLDIRRLFGLVLKGFHVCAVDGETSSSLVWLKHTNPDVLRIVNLENVKSLEEARSIRLMEKNRIQELSLEWDSCVRSVEPMELLTELVPPSSVKDFTIMDHGFKTMGCADAIIPDWCMHITKYLPNLVSLQMWGLPCSSLPTLLQLPNLRKIILLGMHNLEELNTSCCVGEDGENELRLAKLEFLEIIDCPRLRIKPCPPRAVFWQISCSDNVLSSWGECASSTAASSSSPVSKLKVELSDLPLHQWRLLHHLPGLSDLTISCCSDLTISPQITRAFTSLESLSLRGTHRNEIELPEWLGELTSLRQLHLEMHYLHELDENMRQLTQLQSLSLECCDKLTSLPQWLGELALLKTLKITCMKGIISLPESVLTNLQELDISFCPRLYDWCHLEENQTKLAHMEDKFLYEGDLMGTL